MKRKTNKAKTLISVLAAALLFSLAGLTACSPKKADTEYNAEFTWTGIKATATLTPEDGGDSIQLDADVERETTPATCEAGGVIKYTATVTYSGKTYTDVKEVRSDALGHDYGDWTPSGKNDGTHTKVCGNDQSHVLTEDCTYKTVITVTPTVTVKGHGKSSCSVCGDIAGETDLPTLGSSDYTKTESEGYTQYSVTVGGIEYSFKAVTAILQAESAQRLAGTYGNGAQDVVNNTDVVRLGSNGSIDLTFIADDDINDVILSVNSLQRTNITEKTVFDLFTIAVNDKEFDAEAIAAAEKHTTSKWGEAACMKAGTVSLKKGVNHISIVNKSGPNGAALDYVKLDYVSSASVAMATTKYTASFGNEATLNVKSEDPASDNDGIYTSNASGYINPYTEALFGECKSVRLTTLDTVEFSFEVDKDVDAYFTVFNSLRQEKAEPIGVFDLYKLFVNGEEITAKSAFALDSSQTSAKAYGEWHTLPMAMLSFKSGTTYTVKLQARQNEHLDYVEFAYIGDAQFDPVVING